MSKQEFEELAGRIDGVARALMGLIAELEIKGAIDGPEYRRRLRQWGEMREPHPGLESSGRLMLQIARETEEAAASRAAAREE